MQLNKIDPKFRILIDQLFFTDRTDLDISNLTVMLAQEDEHYRYLWDRLIHSTEISWDESFWINRFDLLLSCISRKNIEEIGSYLLSRFNKLIVGNYQANPQVNNEYKQFLAWVKTKVNRQENIIPFRDYLLGLVHTIQVGRLAGIVENFIPFLFSNMGEYTKALSEKAGQSARSFEVLQQLENQGLTIDKTQLYKFCKNLLFKRAANRPNRRSLLAMLNDVDILTYLKSEYSPIEHRPRLLELLQKCDYKELEEYHLRNIKNLLELDTSIADELLIIYADKLYARGTGDKGANIKRLIRACKAYPQFSPKKILAYLSANSRMADIKLLVSSFPDLKTLVPFV